MTWFDFYIVQKSGWYSKELESSIFVAGTLVAKPRHGYAHAFFVIAAVGVCDPKIVANILEDNLERTVP
jgi:hypothetical protein